MPRRDLTQQSKTLEMRELIYYVASTLDGFIAREDGSFNGFSWDDEYGADLFASFPETIPVCTEGTVNVPTTSDLIRF